MGHSVKKDVHARMEDCISMYNIIEVLFPNRAQSVVSHVQKAVMEETAPKNASVTTEVLVTQQQASVTVVQVTQENGAKMNVQLELLEYSVQRRANV
uniref:Uncharacterized protein n=1 Tax=Sphaerodactylus townsendi TaxID=933632 RepID=A0ACB8EQW3_9SAUR